MLTEKSRRHEKKTDSSQSKRSDHKRLWRRLVAAIIIFQVFHYGLKNLAYSSSNPSPTTPSSSASSSTSAKLAKLATTGHAIRGCLFSEKFDDLGQDESFIDYASMPVRSHFIE